MNGRSCANTKAPLQDLVDPANTGRLKVFDFQRNWGWDYERIFRVSASFPISVGILLQTGRDHIRFKPRPLGGSPERLRAVAPETLALDCQLRLTLRYPTPLGRETLETKGAKGEPMRRWYGIDTKPGARPDTDGEDAVPNDAQEVAS